MSSHTASLWLDWIIKQNTAYKNELVIAILKRSLPVAITTIMHYRSYMAYSGGVLHIYTCTAKIAQPVQACWKQHWTMFCCPHFSMLITILFSIVTPDCKLIQAQQCWTILLTILNNVGGKTLFNALFNSPEQVVRFLLCLANCTCFEPFAISIRRIYNGPKSSIHTRKFHQIRVKPTAAGYH